MYTKMLHKFGIHYKSKDIYNINFKSVFLNLCETAAREILFPQDEGRPGPVRSGPARSQQIYS